MPSCACGCGAEVPSTGKRGRPRLYVEGHDPESTRAALPKIAERLCRCGCGRTVEGPRRKLYALDSCRLRAFRAARDAGYEPGGTPRPRGWIPEKETP